MKIVQNEAKLLSIFYARLSELSVFSRSLAAIRVRSICRHIFSNQFSMAKSVLIYGGAGQLGSEVVKAFRAAGWSAYAVDLRKNDHANVSITISGDAAADTRHVLDQLHRDHVHFDAVICAAGGWTGGNAASDDLFAAFDRMHRFNTLSALATTHVAAKALKEHGLVALMGAAAAVEPTPGMLSYGVSKAATHHIVKSAAAEGGGLPKGATIAALCPLTLDTPTNRADMPNANFDNWTPLSVVASILLGWAEGKERPKSGSLIKLVTKDKVTKLELA